MSGATYPKDLKVQAADGSYFLLISMTEIRDICFGQSTIGHIDILCWYINMIKQIFFHEPYIALQGCRVYWKIFVQVESNYIFKAQG